MKINDLIDKFTINPLKEIVPHFKLTKTLKVDSHKHEGCFNCNDTLNQGNLLSTPWTSVQRCVKCSHLNVIYYSDRMGGVHVDTIECYTNK